MEKAESPKCSSSKAEEQYQDLLLTLPKERDMNGIRLHLYNGFWCPDSGIKGVLLFQQHFKAHDTDIILASTPKSGTTWLKSLAFTIVNRSHYSLKESPLLTTSPHQLVPFVEFGFFTEKENKIPNFDQLPHPRIFTTHIPYGSLPSSVKNSDCKTVYICRNPLDQFISMWHFSNKTQRESVEPIPLEEAFDKYCQGVHYFGPFWDSVLGYWKISLERPDKVLFLKYEDLKEDNVLYIKKLAKFMGYPFSEEEETQGLIGEISKFCSFESMEDFEVTKSGKTPAGFPNSTFFRKGKVGDWLNYLTPSMVERMGKLIEERLQDSGLSFNLSCEIQKDT